MDKTHTRYFGSILLFLLSTTFSIAQKKYGNEWLNTSQVYLRIPVIETGFYTITAAELREAGFPADSVAASSLQLFRRGLEVAIETSPVNEKFGNKGYVSFYGEKNDGAPDSSLYVTPKAMPHANYSLYSDTASYFLTYNKDSIQGKRIAVTNSAPAKEIINYHFQEVLQISHSDYPAGNLYPMGNNYDNGTALTTYDVGEGWTGKSILNNQFETLILSPENYIAEKFDQAEVEILITGRSAVKHQVIIKAGHRTLDTLFTENYNAVSFKTHLNPADISTDGKVIITISPVNNSGAVSVSYVKWLYPRQISVAENNGQKVFNFPNNLSEKTVVIKNAKSWQFYDTSNPSNIRKVIIQDSLLPLHSAKRMIAFKEPLKITKPRLVKFRTINAKSDYLIISHPLVRNAVNGGKDPVQEYADYRSGEKGGSFTPIILNSEEIFDQFNYGEPGPLGIRNAISYLHKNASLRFVLLLGTSIDPQTARHQAKARQNDMIPNAGWPGSDMALTMGLEDSSTFVPLVPIGRVNAANAQNVSNYLQKVKTFESQPDAAAWRKNMLHLSGGHTAAEREVFLEYVKSFEKRISGSLGATVQTISKKTDELTEHFPIDTIINKGVSLLTLFGHSSLNATDLDIGKAENHKNTSFYPAVFINGCASGNIFYSASALSNDWILAPGKGAILFLAHTHNGVTSALKHYSNAFYEVMADSLFTSEPFGVIQQEAIRRNMLRYPTLSDGITAQQMNLLGDPAIRIFPAKLPDYAWSNTILQFSDPTGRALTTASDSIHIKIGVQNNGKFRKENYEIGIRRTNNANQLSDYKITRIASPTKDTISFTLPNRMAKAGTGTWNFAIDPDHLVKEENKENNFFQTTFLIPESNDLEPAEISAAGVSPNPSDDYFRFHMFISGLILPGKWTVSIFDNQGRNIYKKELPPHLGANEHLWYPKEIPVGIYIYRIEPDQKFSTTNAEARDGLTGKLIWMR